MIVVPQKIDKRAFSLLAETLLSMVPHYTPEWKAGDGDAGTALTKIHAFITEMVITRLNQVPRKVLVAFLDMLGIKLLPAQPSRVPVAFKLSQGTDRDILVPQRTQATAGKTEKRDEVPFETEENLLVVASKLKELISVDPSTDSIYVHSPSVVTADGNIRDKQDAFTLFSGVDQQEHSLYLGQKDLLNIKGPGQIRLAITVPPALGNAVLEVVWEYWGEDKEKGVDRWVRLEVLSDGTDGLSHSGEAVLYKGLDGEIKETKLKDIFSNTGRVAIKDSAVAGMKNRWIRCRLVSRLTGPLCVKLPTAETPFLKTAPAVPVPIEAGFFNDVPLDYTKTKIEAKVTDCGGPIITAPMEIAVVSATFTVDRMEEFTVNDEVVIIREGREITEATLQSISIDAKQMTISFTESYSCAENDTVRTKGAFAKVFAFGSQPKLYDAFYMGDKEAFSKKGAKISLSFFLSIVYTSPDTTPPDPTLAWEYWDGKGWQAITVIKDDTNRFVKGGDDLVIEFLCPETIQETEVFGQTNYWIRARIIGGDYGREEYTLDPHSNEIRVSRKFKVPVIRDLTVQYAFDTSVAPGAFLSFNNLDFQDRTPQAGSAGAAFSPFVPLPDSERALYLGFDKPLQGGPVRLFFDAEELRYEEENKPEIEWRFGSGQGWSALDFLDETEGFVVQGLLELIGPAGFAAQTIFDTSLYWLRGSLVKGAYQTLPNLRGVFPNATWSVQAETIRNEIIGSSNGEPDQTFSFFKFPVMEGEEVRVKEVLSEEEKQRLIEAHGPSVISETTDESGAVTEVWVLWGERPDFFGSSSKDRIYTLDRATGLISFGNGVNGMIPAAGEDNIKAFSYRPGGGAQGNVDALEIKSLKSAVSGIDRVMNPIAADGGADTATVDEMIGIGPAAISHHYRAVTAEDFEWLARMASRKVARARCLPNRNREGRSETGWVTVLIVPESAEEKPTPSLLLKREVEEYLSAHSLSTLVSPGHVHVDGPVYIAMSISADLFVASMDAASLAVREAMERLAAFFHPLTGGPTGEGWEFGRGVAVSDVYALLEGIEGVDHVENLIFPDMGEGDFISIPAHALVANGEHTLNARLNGGR